MTVTPPKLNSFKSQYVKSVGLDPERMPSHVAIIMDGNGRWAQAQGKHRLMGHNQGYLTLKKIVMEAEQLGLKCLTVYGFSTENWRRSPEEVGGLMRLMLVAMRTEIDELIQKQIRVRISGRLHELPSDLREEFEEAAIRTSQFTNFTFNLAINYGGRAEVVDSVRSIMHLILDGKLLPEQIEEKMIGENLYAPDIPDPDLLIRTAGELRLSNFLLWETAYSEIYVTPTCWPDFDKHHFISSLKEYQLRTRKFGAVNENGLI